MKSAVHRHLLVLALLGATVAGLVLAGCAEEGDEPSPGPNYGKALAGAPPRLAELYDQANELLPGGLDAFNERIQTDLADYPAVVNVWASWCGPCRAEFPHFQQVSARMGKKLAFLGVNSLDSTDAAETFLSTHPLPYPSYEDPDKEIAQSLDATHGLPATAFFNADGDLTYTHFGPYTSDGDLEADVRKYAIEGQTD